MTYNISKYIMDNQYSLLNNEDIIKYHNLDQIIITDFNSQQLGNSSYDCTLGPYYYREQQESVLPTIHNPFSKDSTTAYWGPVQRSKKASFYKKQNKEFEKKLANIKDDELVIPLEPHECILGHTNEFIGTRTTVESDCSIASIVKCRSSMGRNNITICSCSGYVDCDYFNRITLELRNLSRYHTTFLVVNRRVGQIIFFKCNKISDDTAYNVKGKYQTSSDLQIVKDTWRPFMLLPRMYLDYEVAD